MKKILIALIILTIIGAGLYGMLHLAGLETKRLNTFNVVPNDAIYLLETESPIESWQKLSSSTIWSHLRKQAQFAELTEKANFLSEVLNNHQHLFKLLDNHEVVVSAHTYDIYKRDKKNRPYVVKDYDFIFIVNLGYIAQLSKFIQENIDYFLTDDYESLNPKVYKEHTIYEFIDRTDQSKISLAFVHNLLVCSYSPELLKRAIDRAELESFDTNQYFKQAAGELNSGGLGNMYIQYGHLNEFVTQFLASENESVRKMGESLYFTALNFKLQEDEDDEKYSLRMRGATNVNDSINSYFRAMLVSGSGTIKAPRVIPQSTAFYFSLTFDDFVTFQENLDDILQENETDYEYYQRNIRRIENFLSSSKKGINITLKDNFFAWIDDEIAVVEVESKNPQGNPLASKDQFALFLKANDINQAKQSLALITSQIRRKTPIQFKDFDHRGHTISFMSIKGFFKLILGKYFDKIEKPYFTVVEDYVVFSNHPQTLKTIIDEYQTDLTLAKSDRFTDFFDEFNGNSNAFIYINTPNMRRSIGGFLDPETRAILKINRNFIDCFSQFGFQLNENDELFDTRMVAIYENPADVRAHEQTFSKLREERISSGAKETGFGKILDMFDDDGASQTTSNLSFQQMQAPTSDLIAIENIKVENVYTKKMERYYENGKKRFEVRVIQDSIKDGIYKEYYESGKLRIKGRYKNNLQEGVWRYYYETGGLDKKERFRKGEEVGF